MPGRSRRIPRCPTCAALLSTDRTIDEQWVRRHPEPDLWVYRLACGKCLSVARVEVPAVSAVSRSETSRAVVDVAGGVTARLLERLSQAGNRDELAEVVDAALGHDEHCVLLRIPEVFARARSLYTGRVLLRREVVADWPDNSPPAGRLTLHPAPPRDPEPRGLELRLASGTALTVTGHDGGSLLLEPPRDGSESAELFAAVQELVAWPDFLVPRAGGESGQETG